MKFLLILTVLILTSCHHSISKVEWNYPPCPEMGTLHEVDINGLFQCRVKKWTHVYDPVEKHLYKVLSPGPDCWQYSETVPVPRCNCYVPHGVQDSQGIFEYRFCGN